jgi:hypothetical protein
VQKSSGAHFFMEIEFVFGRATVPPKKLILFLPAALCRLAKSLNRFEQMGWLVGAVGIEPHPNFGGGSDPNTLFSLGASGVPAAGCISWSHSYSGITIAKPHFFSRAHLWYYESRNERT